MLRETRPERVRDSAEAAVFETIEFSKRSYLFKARLAFLAPLQIPPTSTMSNSQASTSALPLAAQVSPAHAEWALIQGYWPKNQEAVEEGASKLAKDAVEGNFSDVLKSKMARDLFAPIGRAAAQALSPGATLDLASVKFQLPAPQDAATQLDALSVAVSALHAFVQLNWTGPDFEVSSAEIVRSSSPDAFPLRSASEEDPDTALNSLLNASAFHALTWAGEPAYHLSLSPFLLVAAHKILDALDYSGVESLAWWKLRAATVHSHVLDEAVPYGSHILQPVDALIEALGARAGAGAEAEKWSDLQARLILERGLALQRTGNDRDAADRFVDAAKASGLKFELSGALGKRTKFQKEDKTQLVLLAESRDGALEQDEKEAEGQAAKSAPKTAEQKAADKSGWQAAPMENQQEGMPSTFALNDDTLLEQTKFTSTVSSDGAKSGSSSSPLAHIDPADQPALSALDQSILLAMCLNIKNMQPEHGLTASQMGAFVSRVVSHPRNWSVHTTSLLLRSRLEAHRTRTVERAVLQLQALIDQMPTADSTLQERLRFFHALELPPKWEMQAELAKRYAALGVVRSALEIFERIELWEEVVQCLGALGRQEEGVEVVRDLLEGRKVEAQVDISRRKQGSAAPDAATRTRLDTARQAKLWCLLGDLEPVNAFAHYTRAWEVSQGTSARAARSLGGYHFARVAHAEAARWLKAAVRINPLYTRSWFTLGCAYMRFEKWDEAGVAFRRCTALDDEDGESWNNLASCYLRMGEAAALRIEAQGEEDDIPALREADADSDAESLPDSGVELSSTDDESDAEDGRPSARHGAVATRPTSATPYALKMLAHRALERALKYAHENWRVWTNFMIVSVDVGLLGDATRALERVVQLRTNSVPSQKEREATVDLDVLDRLVNAVIRAPSREEDAVESAPAPSDAAVAPVSSAGQTDGPTVARANHNPHEGHGLYPAVRSLFDHCLLQRISGSPRIWRSYARLLLWRGDYREALDAHLAAYRAGPGNASDETILTDRARWVDAVRDIEELCEMLENLGPRTVIVSAQDGKPEKEEEALPEWRFQARSIVRTFMGRTRASFSDDDEWEKLEDLLKGLRGPG